MRTLKDKAFVITGAGGSIAGVVESVFRSQGARIALVDKDIVRIEGRAKTYNSQPYQCDFLSLDSAKQVIGQIKKDMGRIDGLIHLVGDVVKGDVIDAKEEDYEHVFQSNMTTLFNAVKAVLPELLNHGDGFIAGIGAHTTSARGMPGSSLFVAAKSAGTAFLRSLDAELEGTDVNVSIIFPMGIVDTLSNRKQYADTNFIHPKAIANAFLVAAQSGEGGSLLELPVYPPKN